MPQILSEKWLYDPHHFLGLHSADDAKKVIRLYRPEAATVHLEVFGTIVQAFPVGSGIFEYEVPAETSFADYRVYHQNGLLAHDPYAFSPTLGEMDIHLFSKGVHYRLYEVFGVRVCTHQGIKGVKCAVWAPNASSVSFIADCNFWDGRIHPMRSMGCCGIWELFIPGIGTGAHYKFEIRTKEGRVRVKSDPFATFSELRPLTASVVFDVDTFKWTDEEWIYQRLQRSKNSYPLNIYEVHLGSWKKKGDHFLNYRTIAHELADYCREMGFSHVELMPVAEHPLDESWGYQVTGFYAVTSRYGTPEDFQYFVNHIHSCGIGVFIDWVPGHFPTDDHSLAQFDGSFLFEHADPRQGFHPHWNTYIFNYGRFEVSNFLIANALFWFDKMHIDGLRVDAVASMLYLDYGRSEGEWIPNIYGGKENLEAIEFIKHLNAAARAQFPGIFICAEESTAYTGISHPLEWGGLGFDLKWNMGWMNDTLRYFCRDCIYRSHHQNELTFALLYAFSEKFLLPFSHDEVVHGKSALLAKMPGDDWQKFANMRLLYSYMICQPGKKLLFMGGEFGQWWEWNCKGQLQWDLLHYERHQMLHRFFKELNHFYHASAALWEFDFEPRGFEWIDFSDQSNCTISYLRKGSRSYLFCVHNFTPNYVPDYFLRLQNVSSIREVFNTDREEYWGSGKINPQIKIAEDPQKRRVGVHVQLAPLATMIFEVQFV
ncbi:MAG TPA: 1,4-alpha-glucan branching protein GlgB [Rhabdochlamydiaceae bacterium]|jgi:1,4-alpha-glucan branching enzyme